MTKSSGASKSSSKNSVKKTNNYSAKKSTTKTKNATAKARTSMEKFKMEAANEVGVHLKADGNGHLTARQAGSIGGRMVKKMIESYKKKLK